jgi:hypothetical protein
LSRHREELGLPVSPAHAMLVCREILRDLGWTQKLGATRVIAVEPQKLVSNVNCVKVQIDLFGDPQGFTRVTVQGSNFGFGPIQGAHVQRQVHLFTNRIEQAVTGADEPIERSRPVTSHPWAFSLRVPERMNRWVDTLNELKSMPEEREGSSRLQEQGGLSAELERLAHLRDKGILTEEEFARAKSQLIDG